MRELIFPETHNHIGSPGHTRMHRIVPKKEAERRVPRIRRHTPNRVTRVDILQVHLHPDLFEIGPDPVP